MLQTGRDFINNGKFFSNINYKVCIFWTQYSLLNPSRKYYAPYCKLQTQTKYSHDAKVVSVNGTNSSTSVVNKTVSTTGGVNILGEYRKPGAK